MLARFFTNMATKEIQAGKVYETRWGDWRFFVEKIVDGIIFYTVEQTKQKCSTTVSNFASRVVREI